MTIREGLGYSLKNYDPCFDFNADLFCCSNQGRAFRKNVYDLPPFTPSNAGSVGKVDTNYLYAPMNLKQSGLVLPSSYSLPPQGYMDVPCSRMPCKIQFNTVPCTNVQRRCQWNRPCGN
jgi:hypothetical protein